MTLAQLKYLAELDAHRSFRKAAAACGISQPSLSTQIGKLESELGVQLFDRSRKPVAPTSVGTLVVAQARTVLAETAKISRQVQSKVDVGTVQLRVGVLPTIAPYLMPQLIPRLTQYFPQVSFQFEEERLPVLLEKVINSRLDVAIAVPPNRSRGLSVVPLYTEALVGYVSKGHRLARQHTIRREDLSLEDLWLLPEGFPLRNTTLGLFEGSRLDVPRPVAYTCANLETMKRVVEQNQGMAVLPVSAVHGTVFHRSDLVRHFEEPVPDRDVCLVHARSLLKSDQVQLLATEILHTVSSPQVRSAPAEKRLPE